MKITSKNFKKFLKENNIEYAKGNNNLIVGGSLYLRGTNIKHKNIKIKTGNKTAYIFTKNGVSAHDDTVRQAYLDWLYKTSDRDVSQYTGLQLDEVKPLDYGVIAYRTITGACSFGTNEFLENNKDKYKAQMTLQEVFTATEGQYGSQTFKEFFERI